MTTLRLYVRQTRTRGFGPTWVGHMRVEDDHGTAWTESTQIHRLTSTEARHDARGWRNQYLASAGLPGVQTWGPVAVYTCGCGGLSLTPSCAACESDDS